MPSKSKAQHRMMAACCNDPANCKHGLKRSVACEYMHADRGRVADLPAKTRSHRSSSSKLAPRRR